MIGGQTVSTSPAIALLHWAAWHANGALRFPAKKIKASRNNVPSDSSMVAPLRQSQPFTVRRDAAVIRSIVLLLFHCGPAAITRLVTTQIVDPVNRMAGRWALAHIGKECEIVAPVDANFSPPFTRKTAPDAISARFAAPSCMTVGGALFVSLHDFRCVIAVRLEALSVLLFRDTAARARIAEHKAIGWRDECCAAFAGTFPHSVVMFDSDAAQRREAREFLTRQISRWWHGWN